MTKRSKRYFYRKSPMGRLMREARIKTWESTMLCGIMASRVWKDDEGKIRVHVLDANECFELKQKIDSGELTAQEKEEYIIQP